MDGYRHISVLDLGVLDLTCWQPHSGISKSGHYSEVNKPKWGNPLIFNSPVFCSVSSLIFGSFAGSIPRSTHSFTTFVSYWWKDEHRVLLPKKRINYSVLHDLKCKARNQPKSINFTLPHSFYLLPYIKPQKKEHQTKIGSVSHWCMS